MLYEALLGLRKQEIGCVFYMFAGLYLNHVSKASGKIPVTGSRDPDPTPVPVVNLGNSSLNQNLVGFTVVKGKSITVVLYRQRQPLPNPPAGHLNLHIVYTCMT